MKKVLLTMLCIVAMMMVRTSLKAQEVSIELTPGFNWISVPSIDTLDFATVMGDFTPEQGDIIKSRYGSLCYMNGQWRGNAPQLFYPGCGYHYNSNRTVPVTMTFNVQPAWQVTVVSSEPTNITRNSAVCGGNVTSSNGDYVPVTLKGICWGTNPSPTFNDNYIEAGNGLGNFTVSLTELITGTTYYVRAFAVLPTGTFYGEEVSFTTVHTYVDLGLPSGILWATCNVGADIPEDYGDHFAWGETQPKNFYNWSTYLYYDGSSSTFTKYCNNSAYGYNGFVDSLATLLPEDDAATANWGNGWRIPTKEEWEELYNNTICIWTTQNGVHGKLFTATNGNSLFLPAAGCYLENILHNADSKGYYWSSSLGTEESYYAWCFYFYSVRGEMYGNRRYYGQSVRAVHSGFGN
jgi:uncharacterized protein (TIGR02145 family)